MKSDRTKTPKSSGTGSVLRANESFALAAKIISGRWAKLAPVDHAAKFTITWAKIPTTPRRIAPTSLMVRATILWRFGISSSCSLFATKLSRANSNSNHCQHPQSIPALGLERLAVVLQGVKSNYDTDLIRPIIEFTATLADRHYEPETQEGFAMRVIADHARATAFSIADSILPGNEGRNYVLRKIMRRAIYQGRHTLGLDLFFHKVTNFVVDQMREAFPELEVHRDFIDKMVQLEEERFRSTMTVGLKKLDELFAKSGQGEQPSYPELARLYDTFGTPRDLIRVSMEGRGFNVSEEEFLSEFDTALKQLQQSGTREQSSGQSRAKPVYSEVVATNRGQRVQGI